ncbi:MAG: hypothetical protein MK033_12695 [Candidatus Caenarcaniphilales bacterium]|nr:hypothetical protein [Candidatus Caenarcaniphilales bacterium]
MKINYPRFFDELYFEKKNLFSLSYPDFSLYVPTSQGQNTDDHLYRLINIIFCNSVQATMITRVRNDLKNNKLTEKECSSFKAIKSGEKNHSWRRLTTPLDEPDLVWAESEYRDSRGVVRVQGNYHYYRSLSLEKVSQNPEKIKEDNNLIDTITLLRFEKFAKENKLLCHAEHYQNYFKYLDLNATTNISIYLDDPVEGEIENSKTAGEKEY